ncbi:MAG: hypothetical protein H6811_04865 [Phycisphaeraceae bacterium]|nr:hypothetical protein [Phycisphaeraceae bacterium]
MPRSTAAAILSLLAMSASASGDPGLLIVVPRALADSIRPFAAFKSQRLPTRVAVLDEALQAGDDLGPCADDPERLKRFLYDAWRRDGIGYVLLVGDADIMPVRYMVLDRVTEPAFDYAFYPSDLYYADLAHADGAFEDWNGASEGFHGRYYGEVRGEKHKQDPINFDGVDYRPDIALGRWPVGTAEHVRTVAAKTIAYERAVEAGEMPTRAGFLMVGGWVDARGRMDQWAASMPEGWEIQKRYDGQGADPPRQAEVMGLLREGVGLLVHAGHGSDDTWHNCLSAGAIASMDNAGRTPVMLSAGCSTARFATLPPYEPYEDESGALHAGTNDGEVFTGPPPPPACYARGEFNRTGLGERLLRDGPTGAVVYIGCNTGSQPCGLTLAEGFVLAMAEHRRAGDCWKSAVARYVDAENLGTIEPTESWYPASVFFQGMKFMFFGDPSVPMAR